MKSGPGFNSGVRWARGSRARSKTHLFRGEVKTVLLLSKGSGNLLAAKRLLEHSSRRRRRRSSKIYKRREAFPGGSKMGNEKQRAKRHLGPKKRRIESSIK